MMQTARRLTSRPLPPTSNLCKPVAVRAPSETCLNCERPLVEDRKASGYCDGECRDEHAFILARIKANR
jgi:hypothetical protein